VRPALLQGSIVERRAALAALRHTDLELYVRTIAMLFFPSGVDSNTFWSFVRHEPLVRASPAQERRVRCARTLTSSDSLQARLGPRG
jgi:hypothetical protein